MLCATRARRCASSVSRSFSSKTGDGGVNLITGGGALGSLLAPAPVGNRIATLAQITIAEKSRRILMDLLICLSSARIIQRECILPGGRIVLEQQRSEQRRSELITDQGPGCRRRFGFLLGLTTFLCPSGEIKTLVPSGEEIICE